MSDLTRQQIETRLKKNPVLNLSKQDLSGLDLSALDLMGFDFSYATLTGTNFNGAALTGANFTAATLTNTQFRNAYLLEAILDKTDLRTADFTGADMGYISLENAILTGGNFQGVNFNKTNLDELDFSRANLSEARLIRAELVRANLQYANLDRANLNRGHLRRADLAGASLRNSDLSYASLNETNLAGVDLTGANLENSFLSGVKYDALTKWPPAFEPARREINLTRLAQTVRRFSIDTGKLAAYAFSPGATLLATAGRDQTVTVWDAATGHRLKSFALSSSTRGMVFSPDRKRLARLDINNRIEIWDWAANSGILAFQSQELPAPSPELRPLRIDDSGKNCLAFTPDGRFLSGMVIDENGQYAARLWDSRSGKIYKTLANQIQPLTCIAFSPDGRSMAYSDNFIVVLDPDSPEKPLEMRRFSSPVTNFQFTADGKTVSGTDGEVIEIFEVAAGKSIKSLYIVEQEGFSNLKICREGTALAFCSSEAIFLAGLNWQ